MQYIGHGGLLVVYWRSIGTGVHLSTHLMWSVVGTIPTADQRKWPSLSRRYSGRDKVAPHRLIQCHNAEPGVWWVTEWIHYILDSTEVVTYYGYIYKVTYYGIIWYYMVLYTLIQWFCFCILLCNSLKLFLILIVIVIFAISSIGQE